MAPSRTEGILGRGRPVVTLVARTMSARQSRSSLPAPSNRRTSPLASSPLKRARTGRIDELRQHLRRAARFRGGAVAAIGHAGAAGTIALDVTAEQENALKGILEGVAGDLRVNDFTALLGVTLPELAAQARVHPSTMAHVPGTASVQTFLRQIASVLRAAYEITGDRDKALWWYRFEPLQTFSYKTPQQLVAEDRTADLLAYLESVAAGASG